LVKHKIIRLIKDPIGTITRELRRRLRRYKYQSRYVEDAEPHWANRLGKYGFDLRGVGNEGLSHEENERVYLQARGVFETLCKNENVDFAKVRMLDVGCGTGFYAKVFAENGGTDYLGVDITDTLFDRLREEFPTFKFRKLDITKQQLDGLFGLIIMIDVTQHITDEEKFSFAMQNIKSHLNQNGIFIVTSWLRERTQFNYYEVSRPFEVYKKEFPDFIFSTPLPFRDKFIFAIKSNPK